MIAGYERYDAVVVGAGPAGTTAARRMAKAGLQVLIIDKAEFPRYKTCGGLLPMKAIKELELSVPPMYIKNWIHSLTFYDGHHNQSIYKVEEPLGITVDRSQFDQFLLHKAIGQGARFYSGTAFKGLRRDGQDIKVHTSNGEYQCRYLIGCDGVFSRVKRSVGYEKPRDRMKLGFTVSTNIPWREKNIDQEFRLFHVPIQFSMGWGIPQGDLINIGIGGPNFCRSKLIKGFPEFVERLKGIYGWDSSPMKMKGAFLPAGGFGRQVQRGHILLCGDAAGLVDPFTGEGIYYAVKSGRLAAEYVIHGRTEDYQSQYEKIFRKPLQKSLIQSVFDIRRSWSGIPYLRHSLCNTFGKIMENKQR